MNGPVQRRNNALNMAKLELGIRKTRADVVRRMDLASVTADITHYTCRIPINNAGEARPVVMFPENCKFGQLPSVTFGFELYSTDHRGKMPVFAGSVDEWITVDRLPNTRLYVGARFLISSEAVEDISFVCTATVSGIAYGGPVDRMIS